MLRQKDNLISLDVGLASAHRPLVLRWVEPGSFVMGSPAEEIGRNPDEKQFHMRFSCGFWLGVYLVTEAQWRSIMGENIGRVCNQPDHPVANVSWQDAMACCDRLNEQLRGELLAGFRFSLPTEAQWEYACRAGSTTAYSCGDSPACLDSVAWHGENSGGCAHPVGEKAPNAWGFFDMHGNIGQWCFDRYDKYPIGEALDWIGKGAEPIIINRSASWKSPDFTMFRSACRGYCSPDVQRPWFGFRVALRT